MSLSGIISFKTIIQLNLTYLEELLIQVIYKNN